MASKTSWAVLAGLVACAALALAAVLATHNGAAQAEAPLTAQSEFAVLSRPSPATDVDLFGSKVGQTLAQQSRQIQDITTAQKPYTADATAARTRVDSSGASPRAISVAPASNGGVCVADRQATGPTGIVCDSVAVVAKQGLVSASQPAPGAGIDPNEWDIIALVPDGVGAVTFTSSDGQATRVPVVDNTVTRTVHGPTTMSFVSPLDGPQTETVTPEDAR